MCWSAVFVGAVFFPALVAIVGAIEQESSGQAPPHVAPMTTGVTCGLAVVPMALATASPVHGFVAFVLVVAVGAVAGRWDDGRIAGRAKFSALGFGLVGVAALVIGALNLRPLMDLFIGISEGLTGALGVVGVYCS